jgi:hypothetical protein
MGDRREFWYGNLKEKDYLEYLDVGGRIILKWILKEQYGGVCKLDSSGSG